MADAGTRYTDRKSAEVAQRLKRIYAQAEKELTDKISDYWKRHAERDKKYRKQVEEGTLSKEDYEAWLRGQVFQGEQWSAKRAQIIREMTRTDQTALRIVDGEKQNIFNSNANYIGYAIEQDIGADIGFELFDSSTVARLVGDEPDLLRPLSNRKILEGKEIPFYQKIVTNAITQGIIQGEGVQQIADRIVSSCKGRGENAALRDARTAFTGAQNAGRVAGMKQSEDLGIRVQKKWMATFDFRTRDAHRTLDGQVRDTDKPFEVDGYEIDYPGDPKAEAYLVYNCRCTLGWYYPEYQNEAQRRDNITGEDVDPMTYKEWMAQKKQDKAESKQSVFDAQSVDIPHSKLHPDLSYASNYFAGVVDEDNDYRQRIEGKEYELKEVKIAELYTDQNVNKVEDIRRMMGLKIDEPITVVHADGKDIILDGNTRSAAARLRGEEYIKARVYDLEKTVTPNVTFEDQLESYRKIATPNIGSITKEHGQKQSNKQHEMDTAQRLHEQIGGDIILLDNSGNVSQRDYRWRDNIWELKKISSVTSADEQTKKGIKQIKETGGNLILDFQGEDITGIVEKIKERLNRSKAPEMTVIVMNNGTIIDVFMVKKS